MDLGELPPEPGTRRVWRRFGPALAFLVLLLVYLGNLRRHHNPMPEDDALFFFRYADHLAAGEGYRFNAGEPPVCGASAPLWPLLLAAGEVVGLTIEQSSLAWSLAFTIGTVLLLGTLLLRLFGPLGVLALAPLLAFYHLHSTWMTSGMESPMTCFLVAAGLFVAHGGGGWRTAGLVAGLSLAHKLDLVPFGLALLAGLFVWRRAVAWRAFALAIGLAAAWYGTAAWLFGSPVPNSFLAKLGSPAPPVPRRWFLDCLRMAGGDQRLVLAVCGCLALRRVPFLALLALTQVAVPLAAYTLHPPSEGFLWYLVAVSPALAFLAASGLAWLLRARRDRPPRAAPLALALAVIVALGLELARRETPYVRAWHEFLVAYHTPSYEAGRWVAAHTPDDARVITGWGYPAYYSRRTVIDSSGLNRRPEKGDLFDTHAPEVWITQDFGSVADLVPPPQYRVVQSWEANGPSGPFYAAVLVREEPPATPGRRRARR